MALREAVTALRERAKVLEARLVALARATDEIGGGGVHAVVEQVDKATVDARGWVKRVKRAAKRAARDGAGTDEVRAALADAQKGLDELRRKEPRRLRGRALASDLKDLHERHGRVKDAGPRRVGTWAREAGVLVRAVAAATRGA